MVPTRSSRRAADQANQIGRLQVDGSVLIEVEDTAIGKQYFRSATRGAQAIAGNEERV